MHTRELLKEIGGQAAVARECAITGSAVSQWVEDDEIPKARAQYLRLAHPGGHWEMYDLRVRVRAGASALSTADQKGA